MFELRRLKRLQEDILSEIGQIDLPSESHYKANKIREGKTAIRKSFEKYISLNLDQDNLELRYEESTSAAFDYLARLEDVIRAFDDYEDGIFLSAYLDLVINFETSITIHLKNPIEYLGYGHKCGKVTYKSKNTYSNVALDMVDGEQIFEMPVSGSVGCNNSKGKLVIHELVLDDTPKLHGPPLSYNKEGSFFTKASETIVKKITVASANGNYDLMEENGSDIRFECSIPQGIDKIGKRMNGGEVIIQGYCYADNFFPEMEHGEVSVKGEVVSNALESLHYGHILFGGNIKGNLLMNADGPAEITVEGNVIGDVLAGQSGYIWLNISGDIQGTLGHFKKGGYKKGSKDKNREVKVKGGIERLVNCNNANIKAGSIGEYESIGTDMEIYLGDEQQRYFHISPLDKIKMGGCLTLMVVPSTCGFIYEIYNTYKLQIFNFLGF